MERRLFRTYLAGGTLAVAAYLLAGTGISGLVWDAIVVSAPLAIVVGVRRFQPERRHPWFLLAGGLGMFALGDVTWRIPVGGGDLRASDAAYAVGYLSIAIGCLLLARADRRSSMLAMVDASIGAIGLAAIVWIVVLSGGDAAAGPTLSRVVNASYPVFDILVVTLLIRLAMADRSREPAYWWLVVGFSLMLATDLSYAWLHRSSVDPSSPWLDIGWLASYLAVGAAALHPSMVHLTRRDPPEAGLSPLDVLWLGIPLFAVPLLILLPGHDRQTDLIILAVAAMAIASLVMVRIVSSAKDQERSHREARTAESEYRAVFENSPVAVLKVADSQEILDANPAAERLFGFSAGLRGRASSELLVDPEADGRKVFAWMGPLTDRPTGLGATTTVRMHRGDGSTFWSACSTALVIGGNHDPSFALTSVEDVTAKRAEEERLLFRALHDPLTGLPNRDLLSEGLRRSLARARRQANKVAVLFLDLDGFKEVNDRMGHAVGDELLRALGQRLEATARGGDMVARLGGDEFVIVIEDVHDVLQAEATTTRFMHEIRRPIVAAGRRISIEASIGLVVADPVDEPDDILRRADSAMYEAKRSGSGGWRRFEGRIASGEAG